jgi:hypothetical protein
MEQEQKESLWALWKIYRRSLKRERLQDSVYFLLFLAFLVFLYIANVYRSEKYIRDIDKLSTEIKELRYEFLTTKSELMFKSKPSEVANQLQDVGVKEAMVPPFKIETRKQN